MKYLRLFFVVSSALAWVACASAPFVAPRTALLRVENRTSVPADVFVEGRIVALVEPGQTRALSLPWRGMARVAVAARDGSVRTARDVELTPDATASVTLDADASLVGTKTPGSDESALALGSIEITNPYPRSFSLLVDGEPTGTLFEGDARTLPHLEVGDHVLTVLRPDGLVVQRVLVPVQARASTKIALAAPTGSLLLGNGLVEALDVRMDGRAVGSVPGHGSLLLEGVLAGPVRLTAIGVSSMRRHRLRLAVHEGETRRVELAGKPGALVMRNRGPETLELTLDGRSAFRIGAGEEIRVPSLPPVAHTVEGRGARTGRSVGATFSLDEGETVHWDIEPSRGALLVRNDTPEEQRISLDGLEVALVAPGERAELPRVRVGLRRVVSAGLASGSERGLNVDIRADRRAELTIRGGEASVAVANALDEDVRLYRDAAFVSDLAPGDRRLFEAQAPGDAQFEAQGTRTGRIWRQHLTLQTGVPAAWIIRAASASLEVTNQSGERLRLPPDLSRKRLRLYPGEKIRLEIEPGNRRIALIGERTGFPYVREVDLADGASATWTVPQPLASVEVFNDTPEIARLQIDAQRAGEIPAGGRALLRDLPAGRRLLVAELADSAQVVRKSIRLVPQERRIWVVERGLARLLVENTLDERVGLRLDGELWTTMGAHERRVFGDLPPGRRELSATGVTTGATVRASLRLSASRDARWRIDPLLGTLAIVNRSTEPLDVLVDGAHRARLEPGQRRDLLLPSGKRHVALHGLRSLGTWLQWRFIHPDRTVDLAFAHFDGRIRVRNRLDAPVTLHLAGRGAGTLAPGEERVESLRCVRPEVRAYATLPGGDRRQRALACRANEEVTWELR